MERDETIAGYLRNWKAIQQNRPNQGKSVTKKHRKRPQSGLFHVYIRGTNHKIIFYDNQDRSVFLIILNGEAVKNKSQISAFILMDNHLHLQIKTENLSSLIKCVLSRYAIWFNNRRGWKGPLFEKPFGSSPIHSSMLMKNNILYILSNALRERISIYPEDYLWSSYHFGFNSTPSDICELINIDTSTVEEFFKTRFNFRNEILTFRPENDSAKTSYSGRTPHSDIIKYFNLLLSGRNIYTLTDPEKRSIIRRLRFEMQANYWQIASIVRVSYAEAREACR